MKGFIYEKIISFSLSMIMLLSSFGITRTVAVTSDSCNEETIYKPTSISNNYNKLHFYFGNNEYATIDSFDELQNATTDLTSSLNSNDICSRNLTNNNTQSIVMTVQFESDFMSTSKYNDFAAERETLSSDEEVYNFRTRLNAYAQSYHKSLIEENLKFLSNLEYTSINNVDYSPFVIITIPINKLQINSLTDLISKDNIKHISLSTSIAKADTSESLNGFSDNSSIDDNVAEMSNYTGTGIRIGVLEVKGICDTNDSNLSGIDITTRTLPPDYQANADNEDGTSDHATAITSIIARRVPDAKFYVSMVGDYDGDNYDDIGLEWFISQNCDVVNCSFGYTFNTLDSDGQTYIPATGIYREDYDAIYDYQVRACFLSVVCSAGNINDDNTDELYNPEGYITSPAYAHNVVTVGGVDSITINNKKMWYRNTESCFRSNGVYGKPNISAPYNVDGYSGTSASAAIVTAYIAMIMDSEYRYRASPENVQSVLAATAEKTIPYNDDNMFYHDEMGAGVANIQRMLQCTDHILIDNANTSGNRIVMSEEVFLDQFYNLIIGLSWLAYVDNSGGTNTLYLSNYDLQVYDSSNTLRWESKMVNSAVEMLRFEIPESGDYRIVVYQKDDKSSISGSDRIALSYYIDSESLDP